MKRWLFWLWLRIAPQAATNWLNGKLENAAREDEREQEWERIKARMRSRISALPRDPIRGVPLVPSIYLHDHSDLAQE